MHKLSDIQTNKNNFNDALKDAFNHYPGSQSGSWFFNVLSELRTLNKKDPPDPSDPPDPLIAGQQQQTDTLMDINDTLSGPDGGLNIKHIMEMDNDTLNKLGLSNTIIDKLKNLPETLSGAFNNIADLYKGVDRTLDELTKNHRGYFLGIQQNFGDTADLTKKSSIAMSQDLIDAYKNIGEQILMTNEELADNPVLQGYTDNFILPPGIPEEAAAALKNQANEYLRIVKDPADAARRFADLSIEFAQTYQKQFTGAFKNAMPELEVIAQSIGLETDQISKTISRSIDRTGEASIQNFRNIVKFSMSAQKQTGISAKVIVENFTDIQSNVDKFGNLAEDALIRIGTQLAQVGIKAETLGKLVGQFTNFDSAANAVGNLTAAFGLNVDAMEMMMLANTDQEAFLMRIREQFEEQGLAFEDMNLAQQKLLSQQLGIGIEEASRLFDFDKDITSLEDLKAAQEDMPEQDAFKMLKESAVSFAMTGEDLQKRIDDTGSFGISARLAPDLETLRRGINDTAGVWAQFTTRFQSTVNENIWNTINSGYDNASAKLAALKEKFKDIQDATKINNLAMSEQNGKIMAETFEKNVDVSRIGKGIAKAVNNSAGNMGSTNIIVAETYSTTDSDGHPIGRSGMMAAF